MATLYLFLKLHFGLSDVFLLPQSFKESTMCFIYCFNQSAIMENPRHCIN